MGIGGNGTNGRLRGFYKELDEVVRALKAVHPQAKYHVNGSLGKLESGLKEITAFLITVRGNRKKKIFEMGIEYFGRLEEFYKLRMGFKTFKLTHIYSPRTCADFKEYVFARGSLYWDDKGEKKEVTKYEGKEVDLKALKVAFRRRCAEIRK